MSTATLIEKLTGRRAKADADRLMSYRDLVIALADDDDVPVERVDALLLGAAKSPQQLQGDVETLKQVRVKAIVAARRAELLERAETLSKKCISLRDALAERTRQYQADSIALDREIRANDAELREADAAIAWLKVNRPSDQEKPLREELATLQRRRGELVGLLGDNAQGLRGREYALKRTLKAGPIPVNEHHLQPNMVAVGEPWDEGKLRDLLSVTQSEIRSAQNQLQSVEIRLAEVNEALAEIECNQLAP